MSTYPITLPTKEERHKLFGSVPPIKGTKPTEKDKMVDLQNTPKNFLFALDAVGISNVKHPVVIQDGETTQAKIYSDMLKACIEVGPEICPNFGFLGLIDRQSWYNGIGLDDADPLLFRSDYSPKPAFFSIREALEK